MAFVRNLKQASVTVKYKEKGDEGKEKVNHTQSCRTSEKKWGGGFHCYLEELVFSRRKLVVVVVRAEIVV